MKSDFKEKPVRVAAVLLELVAVLRDLLKRPQPAPVVRVEPSTVQVQAPVIQKAPEVKVTVEQPPKCGWKCRVTEWRADGRIQAFTLTPTDNSNGS